MFEGAAIGRKRERKTKFRERNKMEGKASRKGRRRERECNHSERENTKCEKGEGERDGKLQIAWLS